MLPESLKYLTVLSTPFKGLKLKCYLNKCSSKKMFGISWHTLLYSIKYPDDFFRYDVPPRLIINLFKKEFIIYVVPNTSINCEREYWEAWWNYCNKTNKKENKLFRLNQLFDNLSLTWIRLSGKNEHEIKTDYYPYILKNKYLVSYLILDKLKEIESKIK